jgi:hypothetical protein
VLENSWQEFDLTGQVTSNGLLSLALKRDANDSRREIVSKEGSFSPELVIEYQVVVDDINTAPTFTNTNFSKATASEDVAYSASIADDASDIDGDSLAFTKISGPNWLQIAVDGALSGTPLHSDVGENIFLVEVTDIKGGKATASVSITVNVADIANTAPTFTKVNINKVNGTEDIEYSSSIADDASDIDGDSLTFTKVSGPNWLQITVDGALAGTPLLSDVGENTFVIEVTDSEGNSARTTLMITIEANTTDSGTGADQGTGTVDTGTDVDNGTSTEENASESSGGSIYYLASLLFLICLYRRRID